MVDRERRSYLAMIGSIGLGTVAGCSGDSETSGDGSGGTPEPTDSPTPEPTDSPTPTDTPTPEPTPTPTPEPLVHEVGDSFTVGEGEKQASYTIKNVETTKSIGGEFGTEANGIFVIVEMDITNEAKETFEISSNIYTLVDSEDREYDASSDAQTYSENGIVFEQVNPGVTLSGTVGFDVPEDQSGRQLRIAPAGYFSAADEHYVNIE